MAWTTPRTWVAGEVVTAALLNTHLRDNLSYLKASPTLTSLAIDQGTADDGSLSLKSSDVAHGVTAIADTDCYGRTLKVSGAGGGLQIDGLAESAENIGLLLRGIAGADNTTHGTTGLAYIVLQPAKISGTTIAAPGANANLVAIRDAGGTTRVIFDAEGDSFQDGTGWTAYDDYDDLALVEAVDRALDPTLQARAMEQDAAAWLEEQRAFLQAARIVDFNADTDGVPFINTSRLAMLHNGALRQLYRALRALEARVPAEGTV